MVEPIKTDGLVLLSPPTPPAPLQHLQFRTGGFRGQDHVDARYDTHGAS